jgi:hypothetical protein
MTKNNEDTMDACSVQNLAGFQLIFTVGFELVNVTSRITYKLLTSALKNRLAVSWIMDQYLY